MGRISNLLAFLGIAVKIKGSCLNENIALNKPATQVSDYDFGKFPAQGAVDGNYIWSDHSPTCSHTGDSNGVTPLWWQVDLQDVYMVQSVIITNRKGNCRNCGDRLRDFSVLMYREDPESSSTQPEICFKHNKAIPEGDTVRFACAVNTAGRFLRIQFTSPERPWLTLCEVDVRGYLQKESLGKVQMTFLKKSNFRETSNVAATYKYMSKMECLMNCVLEPICLGFNYRQRSNSDVVNCELFTSFSKFIADSYWTVFHIC